ncbi:MAG: uroporphyrinogen-III synthase, partial [Candidatus Eremiobacteraeota bacterium]|nr:uroporphyrinogen-III synthase [Candidatus Eremiobacteraeota bacterium]
PAQTPIAIVRDGTRPTQETLVATLGTIGDALRRRPLGAPTVAIVGEAVRLREEIRWFDAFPLFGRRVLVTRPAHQAADLAGLLYRRGAQPILAPTIELGPPDLHPERAEYAIDQLDRYDWIVFTSRNGVDAFWAALQRRGADARAIAHRKVAAIGAKTAQALLERGIRADAVPANYQAEDLAEALTVATKRGDRILVYRAQEARDVLQRTLEARQRYVEVVAAYKTTLKDDPAFAEKLRAADVVTFTSASTVAGFVHNLHGDVAAAREKSIACIGPVTAEAARNAGLHVSVVSESSTVQSLVDALEEALPSTGSASLH